MSAMNALLILPVAVRSAAAIPRAYIRHLFKAEEILGMRLAVMHNLWFYNHLMERIRDELDAGTFTAFHDNM